MEAGQPAEQIEPRGLKEGSGDRLEAWRVLDAVDLAQLAGNKIEAEADFHLGSKRYGGRGLLEPPPDLQPREPLPQCKLQVLEPPPDEAAAQRRE